jgi:UDP-N-acetylmuramyl pentapeptide phosphotransferase/UDP-N-acetylglucosamine-1-phosphate transferase
MMTLTAVLAAAAAFMINIILTPFIIRLAHRYKWYDLPDRRKIHTGLIPRLGGPGIFISLLTACLLAPVLGFLAAGRSPGIDLPLRLLAPVAGILLIHMVGLIDDFKNLRALLKFALQLAAAAVVTSGGSVIRSLTLPYQQCREPDRRHGRARGRHRRLRGIGHGDHRPHPGEGCSGGLRPVPVRSDRRVSLL